MCSSDLWAGLMALVNQQAAANGKPPVGFLNPALYDIAGGPLYAVCFHDITTGNNSWTNTSAGTTSGNVYYAVPGYDLCTGWGTPASTALINALVGFSGPKFVSRGKQNRTLSVVSKRGHYCRTSPMELPQRPVFEEAGARSGG